MRDIPKWQPTELWRWSGGRKWRIRAEGRRLSAQVVPIEFVRSPRVGWCLCIQGEHSGFDSAGALVMRGCFGECEAAHSRFDWAQVVKLTATSHSVARVAEMNEPQEFFTTVMWRAMQLQLKQDATDRRCSNAEGKRAHMGSRSKLITTEDEPTSKH